MGLVLLLAVAAMCAALLEPRRVVKVEAPVGASPNAFPSEDAAEALLSRWPAERWWCCRDRRGPAFFLLDWMYC